MNAYLLSQVPLLAGIALVTLLSAAIRFRSERSSAYISALSSVATLYYISKLPVGAAFFGGSIVITEGGRLAAILILLFSTVAFVLSDPYLNKVGVHPADWRAVQLILSAGAVNAVLAADLLTFFLSFETASILSAATVGLSRFDRRSNEAGLKYLLLGILSGAMLLFGIALVFGATGSAQYSAIAAALQYSSPLSAWLGAAGLALILSSLLFKAAAAPFHFWLADIYQGASLSALSMIAAPAKIAAFASLALLCQGPLAGLQAIWSPLLLGAAILSFLFGGLQGLTQPNLKRLLASSAIVHAGFLLLAVSVGGRGAWSWQFYLMIYALQTATIIALMMMLGTAESDVDELRDLAGLGRRLPWLAVALTATIFAFAGIPPSAGFAAKLAAFYAAGQEFLAKGNALLGATIIAGALASTLSLYFYFRLVRAIWLETPGAPVGRMELRLSYLSVSFAGTLTLSGGYLALLFTVS
ncbi:MAG: hypothetical protein K1X75_05525 [Leptospirales bacterium]|nr:hypothetical protein [Leptospirales bacterium]